jgi:hypothetical protein
MNFNHIQGMSKFKVQHQITLFIANGISNKEKKTHLLMFIFPCSLN